MVFLVVLRAWNGHFRSSPVPGQGVTLVVPVWHYIGFEEVILKWPLMAFA